VPRHQLLECFVIAALKSKHQLSVRRHSFSMLINVKSGKGSRANQDFPAKSHPTADNPLSPMMLAKFAVNVKRKDIFVRT